MPLYFVTETCLVIENDLSIINRMGVMCVYSNYESH